MTFKTELKPPLKNLREQLLIIGWIFVFLFPPIIPYLLMIYERKKTEIENTETGIGCCTNYYFLCGVMDCCILILTILGWFPGVVVAAVMMSTF